MKGIHMFKSILKACGFAAAALLVGTVAMMAVPADFGGVALVQAQDVTAPAAESGGLDRVIGFVMGLFGSAPAWLNALLALFVALKGISTLTVNQYDNKAVDIAVRVLNFLVLNVGKDKNADAGG